MSTEAVLFHQEGPVGYLTLDLPGEPVNKLSSPVMQTLSESFKKIEALSTLKVLIIKSAKKGIFIAGADIQEIQSLKKPEEAFDIVRSGQLILDQISQLSIPTIAAIQGACLGGGLELALACDFRICSDSSKVKLGLPEVNLGIIPGFGGTQRLPRLIGLQNSLPLILMGKAVDGKKGLKLGIVDAVYSDAFFESKSKLFIQTVMNSKQAQAIKSKRRPKGLVFNLLEKNPLGRFIIFNQAKKTVLLKTHGHYPAPLAAIKAVKYGYTRSINRGLVKEAQLFSSLVQTEVAHNLIQLFFSQESLKKQVASLPKETVARPVNQAGVLGAGLMGGGISWLLSYKGIYVRMKDIDWLAIGKGYHTAKDYFSQLVKRRRITKREMQMGLHRLSGTLQYEGLDQADVVIEAIVENMDLKKQVFQTLETHLKPEAIIASNTSSLSITDMSQVLTRPQNFVGLHFFSPVNRMPLVEIIPGEKTSPQTIKTMVDLVKKLNKTPVIVKNCPGFLVNRILIPYVNEAVHCIQDGASMTQVDKLMTTFGMPLGPLALADEVGLDVGYKVARVLEEGYGERMAVAKSFEPIYESKMWGKKSKEGFYTHSKTGKKENEKVKKIVAGFHSMPGGKPSKEELVDRLILTMVNEAAKCLEEFIVEKPEYLDMAMILGTGFPPFQGGLCRYADNIGIEQCVGRLSHLNNLYGKRFEPALLLQDMAKKGQTFYDY